MHYLQAFLFYPFYAFDIDSGPGSFLLLLGLVASAGLVWFFWHVLGDLGLVAFGVLVFLAFLISVVVDIINLAAIINAAMESADSDMIS